MYKGYFLLYVIVKRFIVGKILFIEDYREFTVESCTTGLSCVSKKFVGIELPNFLYTS